MRLTLLLPGQPDSRTVKFPANILRSVVRDDGVYGTFELAFDKHNKFESIRWISG